MRTRVLFLIAVLAACAPRESAGGEGGALNQGAPNTAFEPAFPDQTRAPETLSGVEIDVHPVVSGLAEPWALAFLPDGRLLVTERPGRLRVVTQQGGISAPLEGVPEVDSRGQGGLLDVVLGPGFATDRMVYFSFSEPRGNGANGTSVARGRLSDDASRLDNVTVIFRQQPPWRSTGHFGSRLVFDREGRLFITLGERQRDESRVHAQDLSTTLGKVVRINADGSIPADNPFVGRAGADPAIWSYGHRNVQGADLDPDTGALWTIEHGPQGGDELNQPLPGRNYGWPVISYGEEYDGRPIGEGIAVREGMEQPVYYWDPVIAPGDMDFYRGALFPWHGNILIAGLRDQSLVRLVLENGHVAGEERFHLDVGRLRDLAEASDGSIWVITDESNGGLYRLTPRN